VRPNLICSIQKAPSKPKNLKEELLKLPVDFEENIHLLKIIDIGHRQFSAEQALTELEAEVSKAMFSGNFAALKIIHGHGSGVLRNAVRTWCQDQYGRFQAVIPGEDYDLFHEETINMRRACGQPDDPDLGRKNKAVTYIWFW
jgi:hypothetical protein